MIVAILGIDDKYYIVYCKDANSANSSSLFDGNKIVKDVIIISNGKITNCKFMFYQCINLISVDLSKFDTCEVKYMSCMFCKCKALKTVVLSNVKTNKVETMESMFKECSLLKELNLSSFDTNKVETFSSMFGLCTSLEKLTISDNFKATSAKNRGRDDYIMLFGNGGKHAKLVINKKLDDFIINPKV